MTSPPRPDHRIAKLLARAGIASRREIERMIAEGRVALDGKVLDTPATLLPSLRGVTVDGSPVEAATPARLFVYHKPPGLLVTERDPAGRPTIYDRLPKDLPRVVPVGRLDLATEGLLLLTTDGGLKRTLELPATGVERAYRARAYGEITQARLEELIEGVEIEGIRYGPIDANLERRTGANVWIELILTEGKNREVRRVLDYLGLQVSRLIRTRYGPFVLGDLPAGGVGEVRQHDLVAFTKALKTGGVSDARVEAVAPRTASRRERADEPAHSPRATPSKSRNASAPAATPDSFRGPAGHKPKGPGRAAPRTPEQGAAERSRGSLGHQGNERTSHAARPETPPAAPRPGFRAPRSDGKPNARSARAAAFAERTSRERAEESAAEARPGRTGPRAARPARAAREDARAGTAGGWPDRKSPGDRTQRPAATPRGGATDKSKPTGPRSHPTTPRRPDGGTAPRGPKGKR